MTPYLGSAGSNPALSASPDVITNRILPLVLLAFASASCAARRSIALTSEPSGASVEIDGSVIGKTPVEVPFEHYGARQVTMTSPGYSTWTHTVRVRAPWYGRFPMDIVTEVLLPFGWKDRHKVHAKLEQQVVQVEDPDLQAVLARARALRAIMERAQDEGADAREAQAPSSPSILPPVEDPASDSSGGPVPEGDRGRESR